MARWSVREVILETINQFRGVSPGCNGPRLVPTTGCETRRIGQLRLRGRTDRRAPLPSRSRCFAFSKKSLLQSCALRLFLFAYTQLPQSWEWINRSSVGFGSFANCVLGIRRSTICRFSSPGVLYAPFFAWRMLFGMYESLMATSLQYTLHSTSRFGLRLWGQCSSREDTVNIAKRFRSFLTDLNRICTYSQVVFWNENRGSDSGRSP
jgi:hypothetical protein